MPESVLLEAGDQRQAIQKMMDLAHKSLLKTEDQITVDLMRTYQESINRLANELVALNAQFLTGQEPNYSQWRALELETRSARLIAERMGTLNDQVTQELLNDLTEFYKTAYDYTAWGIDQSTPPNVDINYNMPSDAFLRSYVSAPWKGSQFSDSMYRISSTMARSIQQNLTDAVARGSSVPDFAASIRELTGIPSSDRLVTRPRASAQLYRATLIARTEMIRIARLAQRQVFNDNRDLVVDEIWTAAPGGVRVCEDCMDRDGLTRTEIENGKAADDLDVDPPGHPNCRCFYRPQLKTWKELLGTYGKGMADLEHIDEWEMKTPNPEGTGLQKVTIQPYEEWAA